MNKTVTNQRANENQCRSREGGSEASGHRNRNAVLTVEEVDDELLKHGVAVHDRIPLNDISVRQFDKGMELAYLSVYHRITKIVIQKQGLNACFCIFLNIDLAQLLGLDIL